MNLKFPLLVTSVAVIAVLAYTSHNQKHALQGSSINDVIVSEATDYKGLSLADVLTPKPRLNFAGAYLASQFAQRRQQWPDAAHYLDALKSLHPEEPAVIKRSVVLEMGANHPEIAIAAAKELLALPDQDDNSRTLAYLFVITGAFKTEDYDEARRLIGEMPLVGLTLFMKPLLESWVNLSSGSYDLNTLRSNTMLMMHAAYMADYLDKPKELKVLLAVLLNNPEISLADLEQIGDMYALNDEPEAAQKIYETLAKAVPSSQRFKSKVSGFDPALATYQPAATPRDGLARAYYDMAFVLYQDYSDDSARIFANMALYLNEDLNEAHILLGALATRHEHYEQAISYYYSIPASSPYYLDARREAAGLYEDADKPERSMDVLMDLYNDHADLESLIKVGDIHRRQKDNAAAVKIYNQAFDHLGNDVPASVWHLHYVRGMALEQLGQWELASQDLEAALTYQPNHPYVLNYLGYALADRGLDLDRALGMLDKALSLQPQDGYITDSMGWVYYKLGQYQKAVPYLEKAAELLPSDPTVNDHLGDAYWKTGRKLEAKYQWMRAVGYAENAQDALAMEEKIAHGLQAEIAPAQAVADRQKTKGAVR